MKARTEAAMSAGGAPIHHSSFKRVARIADRPLPPSGNQAVHQSASIHGRVRSRVAQVEDPSCAEGAGRTGTGTVAASHVVVAIGSSMLVVGCFPRLDRKSV